jgi:hypothetical protein
MPHFKTSLTKSPSPNIRSSPRQYSFALLNSKTPSQPPALRLRPPPVKSSRLPILKPSSMSSLYCLTASRFLKPKWESISSRSCQVLRLQPTKTLCPDHRYWSSSPRLFTTPALTGFRWIYRTSSRRYSSSWHSIDLYRFW